MGDLIQKEIASESMMTKGSAQDISMDKQSSVPKFVDGDAKLSDGKAATSSKKAVKKGVSSNKVHKILSTVEKRDRSAINNLNDPCSRSIRNNGKEAATNDFSPYVWRIGDTQTRRKRRNCHCSDTVKRKLKFDGDESVIVPGVFIHISPTVLESYGEKKKKSLSYLIDNA